MSKMLHVYLPTITFCIGAMVLPILFCTSGISTREALTFIEIDIDQIIFLDTKQTSPRYHFFSKEKQTFKLPADYTKLLNIDQLETDKEKNSIFLVYVKNEDSYYTNSKKEISIYSIRQGEKRYLKISDVIEHSKFTRNILAPISFVIFLFLTILIYSSRMKKYVSSQIEVD